MRLPRTIISLLAVTTLQSLAGETFYVGTYTKPGGSEGIYRFELETATGALQARGLAVATPNPSFLALHPTGKFVYACGEAKEGLICAFAVQPDGRLRALGNVPAKGSGTTHITVDPAGKIAAVANYNSGSVAVAPIRKDGSLGEVTGFDQHTGSGADPGRQKGPHAHSVYVDAAGRHLYCCDLGLDKIFLYRLDSTTGKIAAGAPAFTETKPGAGPRHLAFGADEKHAYVVEEMSNMISAYTHDPATGAMSEIQRISALPADFHGPSSTAEIMTHPNGRYLYVSNRGNDTVAAFAIDAATGKLTLIGHTPAGGQGPRGMMIDPSGHWLLTANQNSNNVAVLKIDPATGKLSPTANTATQCQPVTILFTR